MQPRFNAKRNNQGLSDKRKEFCHKYCATLDRAKAYLEVFPESDPKKAYSNGTKLMQILEVNQYIEGIFQEKRNDTIKVDVSPLIRELQAIALTRINDVVDLDTGDILKTINGDALAAVSEFFVDEVERDDFYRRKKRVKLSPKIQAIDTLLKVAGYSSDLNVALRTLESYGITLEQNESGDWEIKK